MKKAFLSWFVTLALAVIAVAWSAVSEGSPPAAGGPPRSPELLARGKTLFTTNCVTCHGDTGEGNGPGSAELVPKPRNFKAEPFKFGVKPDEVFASITKGSPGTGMLAWSQLSEEDRWALTWYVLNLRGPAKGKAKGKK